MSANNQMAEIRQQVFEGYSIAFMEGVITANELDAIMAHVIQSAPASMSKDLEALSNTMRGFIMKAAQRSAETADALQFVVNAYDRERNDKAALLEALQNPLLTSDERVSAAFMKVLQALMTPAEYSEFLEAMSE